MDIRKHIDTLIIISSVIGACLWMNGKFREIENEVMYLKQEMAVMKAVLLMKGVLPSELVIQEKREK